MTGSVRSVLNSGLEGLLVEIECHISNNLPSIVIVGSANKAVDEAKERVRGAFTNSALLLPRKRITINLAPADIPKTNTSFDLAIAAAILRSSNQIPKECLENTIVIGELGLDGTVRPVRGIIGKLLSGRRLGVSKFVIPAANLHQAKLVPEVTLIPIKTLKQLYDYLVTSIGAETIETKNGIKNQTTQSLENTNALSEIIGQAHAKRALEIAAAGGHNIFFSGPPGTGKSMLAKALPRLLPPLAHEEMLEVTHLHSLTSNNYETPIHSRPFRSPHHSASLVAVIGGGHNLRPGEISLSHRGVLLLDEIPEFSRSVLEALRQPLEDRKVTVSRAKETVEYPANFIFVATANPCPCGFYGTTKACTCSAHQISQYQQRISGPILDRIDLHSNVQDVDHKNLLQDRRNSIDDTQIQERILKARTIQARRYTPSSKLNADMTNQDIRQYAMIEPSAKEMLDSAAEKLNISARSYMKIVKVARTIADLAGSEATTSADIAEALQYRKTEQTQTL